MGRPIERIGIYSSAGGEKFVTYENGHNRVP